MAAEQTKARKPTKNEQRRARKKQAKTEVRFFFYGPLETQYIKSVTEFANSSTRDRPRCT